MEEKQSIPSLFVKLARTFASMAEYDLSMKTIERGLERFPADDGLHIARGSILITLYNKNKVRNDLIEALISFEKSLAINPDNYLASIMAAKIYIKGKAFKKATEKLNKILALSPTDGQALDLLTFIEKKEKAETDLGQDETAESKAEMAASSDSSYDLESQDDSHHGNYDQMISWLGTFKNISGIEIVLLLDKYGMVIKSINMTKGIDISRYGITISNIFWASKNTMKKVGLGVFNEGLLLTPNAHIFIEDLRGGILAVVFKPDADQGVIKNHIEKFIKDISA